MVDNQDADKRLSFEIVYDKGRALVVVDIMDPQVVVPDVSRARSPNGRHLPLNYSRTFIQAGIKVTDKGLHANLAFGAKRYPTFVPWSAVRALIQNGIVLEQWPEESSKFNPHEPIMVETTPSDAPDDPNAMTADELKWFTAHAVEA